MPDTLKNPKKCLSSSSLLYGDIMKKHGNHVRKLDSKIVILKKKFPFHMNIPYN